MAAQELIAAADTYGLTSGRLVATSAALLGLLGAVAGGLARGRARRGSASFARRGGVVALVSGLVAAVVGVLSLITADGGPGTGNGVVGAFLAVLLGGFGMALGGMAVSRSGAVRAE